MRRRNWWWVAGAVSLLALAMMIGTPRQPQSVRPNPVTERRVAPSTPPGTTVRSGDTRVPPGTGTLPGPTQGNTQVKMNNRAKNAAESVDGVREAWAVVTTGAGAPRVNGKDTTVALVGVALESSLKGAAAKSTLDEVSKSVRQVPGIDRVAITSSPTLVSRIKRVSEGVVSGRTPSVFASDMNMLKDKMLSTVK